jgi:hypothetical protein
MMQSLGHREGAHNKIKRSVAEPRRSAVTSSVPEFPVTLILADIE